MEIKTMRQVAGGKKDVDKIVMLLYICVGIKQSLMEQLV
jgi:hypothetical protein